MCGHSFACASARSPLDISPSSTTCSKSEPRLGRLDGLARLFPDPDLFLYMYVGSEALLSSQIEGTQSSFSDLLLFENKEVPGFRRTMSKKSPTMSPR